MRMALHSGEAELRQGDYYGSAVNRCARLRTAAHGGQVLLSGYLYGTNPKGPACAEFVTGKIKWQSPGVGPGAVTYADGNLYLHGENGDVALVEATPEAYREKGRFTPASQPKRVRAKEMAWAYPVVANGRLYIRDLGTLWSYDVRDPKASR